MTRSADRDINPAGPSLLERNGVSTADQERRQLTQVWLMPDERQPSMWRAAGDLAEDVGGGMARSQEGEHAH